MNTETTTAKRSATAQLKQQPIKDRLTHYRSHHWESCRNSIERLLRTPIQSLMTVLVVATAMALPALLVLALNNVAYLGQVWDSDPKISVYLSDKTAQNARKKLQKKIVAMAEVSDLRYVSKAQALTEFQSQSDMSEILVGLDDNPLPASFVLTLSEQGVQPAAMKALAKTLEASPLVTDVSMDMAWVQRLQEMMLLGEQVVLLLASVLSLGVLLAVGNTVRLAIENRRDEIAIVKLVGATDGYVRRPFLYTGMWYGLLGGVLAIVLVFIAFALLYPTVSNLAEMYGSDFSLRSLGVDELFGLIAAGALLGWGGAWLAVNRHLATMAPS